MKEIRNQKMPDAPLISVITVVLNNKDHIEEAIRSVLNQEYPSLEYIVVDGGSVDGTLDILGKYRDNLAHLVSESDDGIADAMNKGIRLAKGDLIGIIHSDDSYTPGTLRAVAAAHREEPEAILHGNMVKFDGRHSKSLKRRFCHKLFFYIDLPLNHPTCFVPRAVYESLGNFDVSYRLAMDYDWLLRAFLSGIRLRYLPRTLANFRAGGAAMSNARQVHREVLRAQLSHGLNPLVCRSMFGMKMAVNCIKQVFGIGWTDEKKNVAR
jgi:GT2 family glycosyltransferase